MFISEKNSTKKILLISGISIFSVIATIFLLIFFSLTSSSEILDSSLRISKEISTYLKNGDIICRDGEGIWSEASASCSLKDQRFSHAGIVCIKDNKIMVIHSEFDSLDKNKKGVCIESLVRFINGCKKIGVYRLKEKYSNNVLTENAQKYLHTSFDFSFSLDSADKIYCTELIYLAMKDSGIELSTYYHQKLKRKIIPVDSCQDPEYFDEIIISQAAI